MLKKTKRILGTVLSAVLVIGGIGTAAGVATADGDSPPAARSGSYSPARSASDVVKVEPISFTASSIRPYNSGTQTTVLYTAPLPGLLKGAQAVQTSLNEGMVIGTSAAGDLGWAYTDPSKAHWDPCYTGLEFSEGLNLDGANGIVFYVKTDAANQVRFSLENNDSSNNHTRNMQENSKYKILAAGSSEWREGTAGKSFYGNSWPGTISFDDAFEGYVYISFDVLVNDSGKTWADFTCNRLNFNWATLGINDGSRPIVAPFLAKEDGSLTLPAGEDGSQLLISPFTEVAIEKAARNISTKEADPLGNGMKASRIAPIDVDSPIVETEAFPGHYDNRARLETANASVNGSTGLVFYVDLPSANKVGFIAGVRCTDTSRWSKGWDPDLMQKVGSSYSVLASGADEWEERTAVQGKTSDNTWWGCAEFDSAFNGYVFIPWSSLAHDGGFIPDFTQDTVKCVTMYPQQVGGEAGVLTFGPLFMAKADGQEIDNFYLAPNRWADASFPQTSSPTVNATTKDDRVTTETIPSPIPAINQNAALRITLNQAWELEGAVYSLYDMGYWVGFTYAGVEKTDLSHLTFYVKNTTDKENCLALKAIAKSSGGETECRLGSGKPYQLLAVNSDEWEHCEALRSITTDSLIALPAGFEGFVKVPLDSFLYLKKDNSLSSITAIQFAFSHADGDGVIVSPMLGVTQDSDPGPSLPEKTTDKIIQPVEEGDIFSQRVMLYWEAFPNAHHYRMEAYQTAKAGLVSSREAFTTSGTVMDLTAETTYAMVVKAYDAYNRVIAVYSPATVTTASADPYTTIVDSDAYIRDPVYYPAASEETTATSEETTATSEETTATSEETTATSEEATTASEETTATSEEATTASEEATTASEEATTTSEEITATAPETTAAVQPSASGGDMNMGENSGLNSAGAVGTTQANAVNPPETGHRGFFPTLALTLMSAGGLAAAAFVQKRKSRA